MRPMPGLSKIFLHILGASAHPLFARAEGKCQQLGYHKRTAPYLMSVCWQSIAEVHFWLELV